MTRLDDLPHLRPPYDLIIDIGCGHSIDKTLNQAYAQGITARLQTGGTFMLYASHPRPDSTVGWSPKQVERLFTPPSKSSGSSKAKASPAASPSSWYRMRKLP